MRPSSSTRRSPHGARRARERPIWAPEAERALLGGLLLQPAGLDWIVALEPDDFYSAGNARIYVTIQKLHRSAEPVDTVTVREELAKRGELATIGGDEYLLALTDTIPVVAHLVHYALIVRERAARRRLLALCRDVAKRATAGETAGVLLDHLDRAARELRAHDAAARVRPIAAELARVARNHAGCASTERRSTRVEALDRLIGGWGPGELVLLGGEAHRARRTLALRVAYETSRTETVALATAAPIRDVLERLLALEGAHRAEVESARLLHLQTSHLDANSRGALELVRTQHGLDLVIAADLDCSPPDSADAQVRRARSLKQLAERLHVPVLATWPFPRAMERELQAEVDHLLVCHANDQILVARDARAPRAVVSALLPRRSQVPGDSHAGHARDDQADKPASRVE